MKDSKIEQSKEQNQEEENTPLEVITPENAYEHLDYSDPRYGMPDLPEGVKTMQQTDHDAWKWAADNGLI